MMSSLNFHISTKLEPFEVLAFDSNKISANKITAATITHHNDETDEFTYVIHDEYSHITGDFTEAELDIKCEQLSSYNPVKVTCEDGLSALHHFEWKQPRTNGIKRSKRSNENLELLGELPPEDLPMSKQIRKEFPSKDTLLDVLKASITLPDYDGSCSILANVLKL